MKTNSTLIKMDLIQEYISEKKMFCKVIIYITINIYLLEIENYFLLQLFPKISQLPQM